MLSLKLFHQVSTTAETFLSYCHVEKDKVFLICGQKDTKEMAYSHVTVQFLMKEG